MIEYNVGDNDDPISAAPSNADGVCRTTAVHRQPRVTYYIKKRDGYPLRGTKCRRATTQNPGRAVYNPPASCLIHKRTQQALQDDGSNKAKERERQGEREGVSCQEITSYYRCVPPLLPIAQAAFYWAWLLSSRLTRLAALRPCLPPLAPCVLLCVLLRTPLYIEAPSPEDGTAVDTLLDQARSAGDPFLAVTLYEKVLRSRPDDTIVMGEAADLMLHAGETEAAKEVRVVLVGV